jgi:predicted nucleotidyltransferase
MHPVVESKREFIVDLCGAFGVRRMDVFGSAARGRDFDPGRSDVDLLVEFTPGFEGSSWGPYFELKERLESLLGQPVDLVEAGAVRNPYILASIERDRQPLYEA